MISYQPLSEIYVFAHLTVAQEMISKELCYGPSELVRQTDEQVTGSLSIETDITERIQYERALQESERFVRSTVDALSAHLAILDEDGQIIAVNRAWRQFANDNQGRKSNVCEGVNYLAVCEASEAYHCDEAGVVSTGIRAVMLGEQEEFSLEYPCHAGQIH